MTPCIARDIYTMLVGMVQKEKAQFDVVFEVGFIFQNVMNLLYNTRIERHCSGGSREGRVERDPTPPCLQL